MERSLDPKTGQSRKIKPIKWSRYLIISIFNFLLFCILVNHNWKATSVILMTYIARVITTLFTTTVEFLLPFFFFTLIYFLFIYFFAGVYGFLFKLYNIVLILPYINMNPPRVYTVLVHSGCYKTFRDWIAYKQQTLIPHSDGGWEFRIMAPAGSMFGCWWLIDSKRTFFLCPHLMKWSGSSPEPLQ